jgi:hypothetical protein
MKIDMYARSASFDVHLTPFSHRPPADSVGGGFTLVEVIISIAIALLLIVGISQVFSIAQRTIAAGTTVLDDVMTNRSVQGVLAKDFREMVDGADAPAIVIHSGSCSTWRSRVDMTEDRDGDNATLNDPTGSGSLPRLSFTQVNQRIHRFDKMCFFVRGLYTRQTSDAPNLVSPTTSNEAFIWLGHLMLPTNDTVKKYDPSQPDAGDWFGPGVIGKNPSIHNDNNLFASDWILGREVILLKPEPAETAFPGPPTSDKNDPLSFLTSQVGGISLVASRYDLAATSIDYYRRYLLTTPNHDGYPWWEHISGSQIDGPILSDGRYFANPFLRRPSGAANAAMWMSASAAQTTPVFVRNCTQCIIDFAGDFATQDPTTGKITSAQPDGQVDYTVDPLTGKRKIRWYGFPRDASNEGKIGVDTGTHQQFGVCPLSDTLRLAPDYARVTANLPPIERNPLPYSANYAAAMPAVASGASEVYLCAWGADNVVLPRPRMLRITLAVDDPTGHLSNEQLYEYVFNLP